MAVSRSGERVLGWGEVLVVRERDKQSGKGEEEKRRISLV